MFTGHPTLTTSSGKPGVPSTMVPANDTGRGNSTLTGQQTFDKLTPELKNGLHEVQAGIPKVCGPFCL